MSREGDGSQDGKRICETASISSAIPQRVPPCLDCLRRSTGPAQLLGRVGDPVDAPTSRKRRREATCRGGPARIQGGGKGHGRG
ncbi:unnamed protein product, partial [Ectocarpus sp. 12 AP-2014]